MVSIYTTTPTTISLSWTTAGSVVDSYEVIWEKDTSGKCPDVNEGSATITGGSTSYTITGVEEDSSYTITATASNTAGSAVSVPVTAMTGKAGEGQCEIVCMDCITFSNHISFSSICPSHFCHLT